ncbi:type II and III secretion system protein family protein [Bradyrhizobium sp. LHD-71]|uniref:type II and III secretion system protein family protein n=1 Tax=Bradyrhizobium sp. LHD-71 TaxID=3072141 RepID=UPI00280E4806|nr:type II and III secretion system protein family protein [Bradyrhizobium sp. LHD-71]MDQ8726875.1 type II and III secretion system protein family protein [Bradyrhizobium sp. LHD-71]
MFCVLLGAGATETLAAEQPSVRVVPLRKPAAQDTAAVVADRGQIRLNVSRGQTIRLSQPAKTMFIADPSIADIQTPSNDAAFVFGKKAGRTSFFALGEDQQAIAEYQVIVTQPIEDLREMLRSEVGDYAIQVSYTPNGAVLSGTVPNAALAESAKSITAQFLGQGAIITNKLRVAGALQVNLKVRVAEVARNVAKEFGFNLNATAETGNFRFGFVNGRPAVGALGQIIRSPTGAGSAFVGFGAGGTNISAVIDALAAEGLVSILAEPNLTAVSGEPASFLAGGEFPIPVAQGLDRVGVEFKRFGVSLEFIPTVLAGEMISVRVKPEVSDISSRGQVQINGFMIPALATRRADTVVELASGQSFAIGGLIRKGFSTNISMFPWLGDIPVLGALFRSSNFQKDETELVIIVTPYIVRPAISASQMQAPTDRVAPPADVDRVFLNRVGSPPPGRQAPKVKVPRPLQDGFILE